MQVTQEHLQDVFWFMLWNEKKIRLTGDTSLSKRDFSRVIKPLRMFGANIKSKKGFLPIEFEGSNLLRPIKYHENKGSVQIKTCIILGN